MDYSPTVRRCATRLYILDYIGVYDNCVTCFVYIFVKNLPLVRHN